MLSQIQLERLEIDGYVVVENVLDPRRDLDPILNEYASVLDLLVEHLRATRQLSDTFRAMPFGPRLIEVMRATGESYSQDFDFSLPKGGVSHNTPMWLGEAVFSVLTNERLLDCIESVIGSEIYSNPVQHVRLKPPESLVPKDPTGKSILVGETPWHQDNGVLTPDADDTNMLTVWFPLVDATVKNGCLVVVPSSHRGELLTHCSDKHAQLSIPEQLIQIDEAVPVPVTRGSILMFHKKLLHASLPNRSDELRSSFDLRYHPTGQPTGRAMFPGFVARSRAHPQTQLRSHLDWQASWLHARSQMSKHTSVDDTFDRWEDRGPLCA